MRPTQDIPEKQLAGEASDVAPTAARSCPTFAEALRFWCKLGFISFGGPTGQISIMHEELVERRKWISERRFLHALNYCMLLPGPEAQQLAIYSGWLLHGTRGGVLAGALFVLPSAIILWGLSWLYMAGQEFGWVDAAFHGLKAAVLAVVASALVRIAAKALKNGVTWCIAAAAFGAIFVFKVAFPFIIASAALIGWLGSRWWRDKFLPAQEHHLADGGDWHPGPCASSPWRHTLKVTLVCGTLWWLPVILTGVWLGWDSTHANEGVFFSKAAVITFGGAYAVLPYVAQEAVGRFGWLGTSQMMEGLGLAETTPGPLIMVLQFVGFVGAWQHPPEGWPPLASATLGAAMTTWVTFVPCFLWILAGAPYIERLRKHEGLSCALSAVTAAVVGVILNLALWFAWQAVFPGATGAEAPLSWRPDWFVVVLSLAAFLGMQRWKWGVIPVVVGAAVLGMAWGGW